MPRLIQRLVFRTRMPYSPNDPGSATAARAFEAQCRINAELRRRAGCGPRGLLIGRFGLKSFLGQNHKTYAYFALFRFLPIVPRFCTLRM